MRLDIDLTDDELRMLNTILFNYYETVRPSDRTLAQSVAQRMHASIMRARTAGYYFNGRYENQSWEDYTHGRREKNHDQV